MGFSTSKKRTTTTGQKAETASTVANNPQWVEDPLKGFMGQMDTFGKTDPYSLVTGPSALQAQAFGAAGNLGGSQAEYATAADFARQAMGYVPQRGTAASYDAPQIGPVSIGAPAQVQLGSYTAPAVGDPRLASAQGYSASGYDLPGYAPVARASASGYDAAQAQAVMGQASRASEFMGAYADPYQREVLDATMSDFDHEAGEVRAQQAADAARNRAFGGSRLAIREAATEDNLARARASVAAKIRSDGHRFAADMGDRDAGRATSVSMNNSQLGTQTNIANMGATNAARAFTADAGNRAELFNKEADNTRNRDIFAGENQRRQFLSGETNRAAEFGAAALNRNSEFNASEWNRTDLARAGLNADAARFTAEAGNTSALANQGAVNDSQRAQFQADLQLKMTQAGIDENRARTIAAMEHDLERDYLAQLDQSAGRRVQIASLLGDLAGRGAADRRADIGTVAELGGIQRDIANQYAQAPLSFQAALAQMYGQAPLGLFRGQTTNGTSNYNETSLTKDKPSMLAFIANTAQAAARAASAGGA